jgi:hypothetical protein
MTFLPEGVVAGFQNFVLGFQFQNSGTPSHVDGGRGEVLACADPVERIFISSLPHHYFSHRRDFPSLNPRSKISAHVDGGRVEGLACAGPVMRTESLKLTLQKKGDIIIRFY